MSHLSHFSQHVRSPVANAKGQTTGATEVDKKDPCGIYEKVEEQHNPLKIRKQVVDGKVLYEEPSTDYLKKYNTIIPGVLTCEERNEIMKSMQQQITRDWCQNQKDKKVDVVAQAINFPQMIKICERQATLENEMKHTEERLRKLEVSNGRRNRRQKHRRRWRKQQKNTEGGIEKIPVQLRDWRYNDVRNLVDSDKTQPQTTPQ